MLQPPIQGQYFLLEVPLQQALWQGVGFFRIYRKPGFFQCLNALLGKPLVRTETDVGYTVAAARRNDLGCLRFSLLCQEDGQAGVAVYAKKVFFIDQQPDNGTIKTHFLMKYLLRTPNVVNFCVNIRKRVRSPRSHTNLCSSHGKQLLIGKPAGRTP